MTYFEKIKSATQATIEVLKSKGVEGRYLKFGEIAEAKERVFVPTDARSEFLANRAMGDWAEKLLAEGISKSMPSVKVVHYGDSDIMSAGEEGFKDFYKARLEDVRLFGKRPDLLVLASSSKCRDDVSRIKTENLINEVRAGKFAIEVRSSKFEALKYMKVRAMDREAGIKNGRETPSFTVKVEDLRIVYRWLEVHNLPQIYGQVFFDSIFAINFLRIFEIIGSGSGFSIENPKKSQEKATIMIPITQGIEIAKCDLPDFTVEHNVNRLGRHDAFVKPVGGCAYINSDALLSASSAD